jgi:hypothetical protein
VKERTAVFGSGFSATQLETLHGVNLGPTAGSHSEEEAMYRLPQLIGVLTVLTFGVSLVHATPPAQKCAAAKQKAAGKKIAAKLTCYSKAVTKALPVDPACLMKAETKFSAAFTKAEAGGGCAIVGDALAQELAADAAVGGAAGLESATSISAPAGNCGVTCSGTGAGFFACAGSTPIPAPVCIDVNTLVGTCSGPLDCAAILPGSICVAAAPGCTAVLGCAKPCP